MVEVPARLGAGQAMGVLGAVAERGLLRAVRGAEDKAGGAGDEHAKGQADGKGKGQAVEAC